MSSRFHWPGDVRVKERVASVLLRHEPSLASKPPASDRLTRLTIAAFACFIALLVLVAAFATDRNGDVDELMMYNPSYMLSHFGKLTFPSYSYRTFFDDPVIIHPPVHVGLIGLVEKLGFTWYYAEAVATVLFLLLGISVIVFSLFPAPVKLGLLFSIGLLMASGENFVVLFGTRPEGEVHAAWFAGLLLLESGRLANWNRRRLFAGAFLLTWASGVHYYACAAFAGIVVYLVWAVRDLGWRDARSRVVAMSVGGGLFGIPYLGLYLAPHLKQIAMNVQLVKGDAGVAASIRIHLEQYRTWAHSGYIPALIRKPLGLGIPLVLFSTLVLWLIRSMRGLAVAALPLQLFVLLFTPHKQPAYLVHEIALFTAALGIAALTLADYLFARFPMPVIRKALLPFAAALLLLYLVTVNPTLEAAALSPEPHVHEGDLARAASRSILGPHARVAGRLGAWYASGADYWWDINSDMLGVAPYEPTSYYANFDAAVEYPHMSDSTLNGATISSLYARGVLSLRGFYFGETNAQLQMVLLSARRVPQVVGYAARNGQVYRFEEKTDGDYEVLSAACPMSPALAYQNWKQRWAGAFASVLLLPAQAPGGPAAMVTALAPRRAAEPAGWIGRTCQDVSTLNGSLRRTDKEALIDSLRREDEPMHFPRSLDVMPGYIGVGLPVEMIPPKNVVRLNQVVKLSDTQTPQGARLGVSPPFSIRTAASPGAFALAIPVEHGDMLAGRCWLQLRLKVNAGRVGFAAYNNRIGILGRTPASILKGNEPVDVVLNMPSLRNTLYLVVFNDGDGPAEMEILDGSVLVSSQDWERNQATLAALR